MRFKSFCSVSSAGSLLILLAGCASPPASFPKVQQTSAERLGVMVNWSTHSEDDAKAAKAVDALLAKPLTAESDVAIALLNNRQLQAAFEDIGIAQAELVQAGLLKNPMFSGAYEFAAGGGPAKINLSVTEDFLSLLAIPLRKQMAGDQLQATVDRVSQAVIDTAVQTRRAFVQYQAAQQENKLRELATQTATASADVARQLHDVGNLNDLELATEEADAASAQLASAKLSADVVDQRASLNEWMGLTGDAADRWTTTDALPDPPDQSPSTQPSDLRHLQDQAITDRLDLRAVRDDVESQAASLHVARQFAFLADASAGASAEREHDRTWETGPVVSVPIPLFDTGNAQTAAAAARWRQARRRYEAMVVQVRTDVTRAVNQLRLASATVRTIHDSQMPLRHKILQQTLLQYNGMAVSPFQVLAARQGEAEAQQMYVDAVRDYWLARIELDRATGAPMKEVNP